MAGMTSPGHPKVVKGHSRGPEESAHGLSTIEKCAVVAPRGHHQIGCPPRVENGGVVAGANGIDHIPESLRIGG